MVHRADRDARFVVIGGVRHRHRRAIAALQHQHRSLPIRFTGHLAGAALTRELVRFDAAYLPYANGVTERCASALAVLAHGVPLITSTAAVTSRELRASVASASTPKVAFRALTVLDDEDVHRLSAAGVRYAEARSVERVAEQHMALYQAVRANRVPRPLLS